MVSEMCAIGATQLTDREQSGCLMLMHGLRHLSSERNVQPLWHDISVCIDMV